jgi:hypothetical protein
MSQQDNNKSNAFFSAFSGGAGGGSSVVTTASNIGTGVGVFYQKLLQDLEFKTLLEAKGISIADSISGEEVEIGLSTDVVGIADGTGWYTFYNSVSDAILNVGGGQTITFFTNIVESNSVSLQLVSDVTFDLNGYSYTLDVADGTNMFLSPSENVKVKFINGALYRKKGVQTDDTDGLVFRFLSGYDFELTFDNSFVISSETAIMTTDGKSGQRVYGGIWLGGNETLGYAIDSSNVNFQNSIFYSETIISDGILQNCIVWNPSLEDVYATTTNGGSYDNCTIRGTNGANINGAQLNNCSVYASTIGVYATSESIVNNCTIYGGGQALSIITDVSETNPCRASNTSVIASNTPALYVDNSVISNCHFETTTGVVPTPAYTIYLLGETIISNCTIYNGFGGSSAIGILIDSDNSIIANNTITMESTDGYCIQGSSSNTAFLSSNVGIGTSIMIDTSNLTNSQTITPDLYGNILIG